MGTKDKEVKEEKPLPKCKKCKKIFLYCECEENKLGK